MKLIATLSTIAAVIMSCAFLVSFRQNVTAYETLQNAQKVNVCFDATGKVTHGDDWKECRTMRVIENRQ